MLYYLNIYFIGWFLGYGIETFLKTFFFHSMNNGILYGPWIPVYGFGLLIASFVSNKIFKLKIRKIYKVILVFLIVVIVITSVEEVSGLLIEAVFHKKFWKYNSKILDLGPYISLEMSSLWGILSLLFVYYVKPGIELFIKKIPGILTLGLLGIHIIDIVFTWLI